MHLPAPLYRAAPLRAAREAGEAAGPKRGGAGKGAGRKSGPKKAAAAPPPPPRPVPVQVTLVEPGTGARLPCLLRRTVALSSGATRGVLTPLDAPCTLLRATSGEDYEEAEGAELAAALPLAAAELLRQRALLLQATPFCLTLRGALCYNEADVIQLGEAEEEDSLGLEVLSFEGPGAEEYLLYAAVDPLVLLAEPAGAEGGAGPAAPEGPLFSPHAQPPPLAEWVPALDEAEQAEPQLKARAKGGPSPGG